MCLNFLILSLELLVNTKNVISPKRCKEYIPIFVDVFLHHKTKQEFVLCINDAKLHLKAAL